ncbi:hypothetical protein CXB51_003229 [Gossypium anomalum]|uniref:Endonuclease/exonuclease/phosphatase domain-containing protein n=1 Tax=Gossypium anomalum TaxID=47600 RepID=A0A8J6DAF9_9ROSI|nr:hypothetical protein CXB51_003229 [Gossypium anomalum]
MDRRGDFNAIMDDTKNEGRRRKPGTHIEDFREVLEELVLVDIKHSRVWFTWVNNMDDNALVKEHLDCFVMSSNAACIFPFIDANVIRQTKSDHNAMLLGTMGKKSKGKRRDPRLSFRLHVGKMTKGLRRLSRIVGIAEAIILWRKLMGFMRFWGHGSLTKIIE